MKKLAVAVLLLCGCAGLVFGQAQTPPAAGSAKGPSVSQAVQQVERDWTDAEKAVDIDKLSAILADDWVGLGYSGEKETKHGFLEAVKSGKTKLDSFEFGPMSVKVLGNVAVVQGSDTETSTSNGKDSSGKYAWMDVFVKRNGNWVAVRSQTALVK
jgi:ketosteroid isomerase-like protein